MSDRQGFVDKNNLFQPQVLWTKPMPLTLTLSIITFEKFRENVEIFKLGH
jgi:hypothetical protein